MNRPIRAESFVLEEGEKKISIEEDERIPNAATFSILKEDHTLGNVLRMKLVNDKNVLFAGYKVPHPLENVVLLKVQTISSSNPTVALRDAVDSSLADISKLEEQLKAELSSL